MTDKKEEIAVFEVGDRIEFDYFGQILQGTISDVYEDSGYVISEIGCVGSGWTRFEKSKAKIIRKKIK